jgi:hypothetical protein
MTPDTLDLIPDEFRAIRENRLLATVSTIVDMRFTGPLRHLIDADPDNRDLSLLLHDFNADGEWICLWSRQTGSGRFWGPISPSDFIFLWNSGLETIDGCDFDLACRVSGPTVYLTDSLQPAVMRFEPVSQTFTQTVLLAKTEPLSPDATPKSIPPFLQRKGEALPIS